MKKKRIIIAGAVLLLLTAVLGYSYYQMGGFDEPRISRVEAGPYLMAGAAYRGPVKGKKLDSLLRATDILYHEGKLKGTFAICFQSDLNNNDTVKVIAGVIAADSAASLPKGYQWHYFPQREVIRAEVNTHPAVAPFPETVNKKMADFAARQQLSLAKDFSLEKYISRGNIITEIPVKK